MKLNNTISPATFVIVAYGCYFVPYSTDVSFKSNEMSVPGLAKPLLISIEGVLSWIAFPCLPESLICRLFTRMECKLDFR